MTNPQTAVPGWAIDCAIELYYWHQPEGVNAQNYAELYSEGEIAWIDRTSVKIAAHADQRIAELEERWSKDILGYQKIVKERDDANATLREQLAEAKEKQADRVFELAVAHVVGGDYDDEETIELLTDYMKKQPKPTPTLDERLIQAIADIEAGNCDTVSSVDELIAYIDGGKPLDVEAVAKLFEIANKAYREWNWACTNTPKDGDSTIITFHAWCVAWAALTAAIEQGKRK